MHHSIIVDLGFGDTGKGMAVNRLCELPIISGTTQVPSPDLVIKFNGTSQAAHNVITSQGYKHTFHQFGSGALQRVRTYLENTFVVDPYALWHEGRQIDEILGESPDYSIQNLITIQPTAYILVPLYGVVTQVLETARGSSPHGSTGKGLSAFRLSSFTLNHNDLSSSKELIEVILKNIAADLYSRFIHPNLEYVKSNSILSDSVDYYFSRQFYIDYASWLKDVYLPLINLSLLPCEIKKHSIKHVIWEPGQGILLDELYGFHPHTTWSSTGIHKAVSHIYYNHFSQQQDFHVYGTMRSYSTRHGAGPFPSHIQDIDSNLFDTNNTGEGWQGEFRIGHLDLVLTRYALANANAYSPYIPYWTNRSHLGTTFVDSLMVSCLDQLPLHDFKLVNSYTWNQSVISNLRSFYQANRSLFYGPEDKILKYQEKLGQILFESTPNFIDYPPLEDIDVWLPELLKDRRYKTPFVSYKSFSSQQVLDQEIYATYNHYEIYNYLS